MTPAMQMKLEYRVTGLRASIPEHRNNAIIERANMLAIDAYMSKSLERQADSNLDSICKTTTKK
jgi:hypothetical protein